MPWSSRQLSGFSKAAAFLALALTLLGSVQTSVSGGLGGLGSGGDIGCVDACGCPPSADISSCCCDPESEGSSDGGASFAVLVGGAGCTPPAPKAATASPAGPLMAQRAELMLPALVAPSLPGTSEARTPCVRSTRPPVPPPRS